MTIYSNGAKRLVPFVPFARRAYPPRPARPGENPTVPTMSPVGIGFGGMSGIAQEILDAVEDFVENVTTHFWPEDGVGIHETYVTRDEWLDEDSDSHESGMNTLLTDSMYMVRNGMVTLLKVISGRILGRAYDVVSTDGAMLAKGLAMSGVTISGDAIGSSTISGSGSILSHAFGNKFFELRPGGIPMQFDTLYAPMPRVECFTGVGSLTSHAFSVSGQPTNYVTLSMTVNRSNGGRSIPCETLFWENGTQELDPGFADGTKVLVAINTATRTMTVSLSNGGTFTVSMQILYTSYTGNYGPALAFGTGTQVNADNQVVIGSYNDPDDTKALIIGNGTSDSDRSNALAVGWDGSINGVDPSGTVPISRGGTGQTSANAAARALRSAKTHGDTIVMENMNVAGWLSEAKTILHVTIPTSYFLYGIAASQVTISGTARFRQYDGTFLLGSENGYVSLANRLHALSIHDDGYINLDLAHMSGGTPQAQGAAAVAGGTVIADIESITINL